jgi:hypothetical protein
MKFSEVQPHLLERCRERRFLLIGLLFITLFRACWIGEISRDFEIFREIRN